MAVCSPGDAVQGCGWSGGSGRRGPAGESLIPPPSSGVSVFAPCFRTRIRYLLGFIYGGVEDPSGTPLRSCLCVTDGRRRSVADTAAFPR